MIKPEVKPETIKPVAKKPVVKKPKPVVVQMPVEEPDLLDSLLADPMMLGIGGGALLFILVLLGLIVKRRRKGGFQESILNGGTSSMMKANDEQGSETSFLSDLAISGMGPGTLHTDEGEVDPLTEADVFMAYGRNQQAEEVLKKAREKSPKRADIAAKLLTVYFNNRDSEQFEELAEEAVGSLQGDDALWGDVLAMGHELCPDNVLFAAGAGAAPHAVKAESAAEAVMDIGLDIDELTAEMEGERSSGMDFDLGLDFSDLDDEAELGGEAALDLDLGFDEPVAEETESAIEEAADMDLGDLDLEAVAGESVSDADILDFDLDLNGADEMATESDEGGMDFDLDLGDLSAEEESLDAATETQGLDLDMGDFDLDDLGSIETMETATESDAGLDVEMSLDDFGDLGDLDDLDDLGGLGDLDDLDGLGDLGELEGGEDEMTTKLDLAQAYAEMGDAEGARSMLDEVVAAGNDEQKQQAQALIDKL
jgi:pilus assembly protein FimV